MHIDRLTITRMEAIAPIHRGFGEHDKFECFPVVTKADDHRCSVCFYRLPPNKANFPYHYHEINEEVFYIVSGSGVVLTEEGTRTIAAGDLIFCPPTPAGAHKIANTSLSEPLVYLEFDSVSYPDVVHYPKSGAFGIVRRDSAGNEFHRNEPKLDYARDVELDGRDW